MTRTPAGLLGTSVQVRARTVGKVTGVLVDAHRTPVLLRVELAPSGEVAYVPRAALAEVPGDAEALGAHILLRGGEASFYEQQGLEWILR
jgi:hypothetical protein